MTQCVINASIPTKDWLVAHGKFIFEIDDIMDIPVYEGLCNHGKIPIILVDCGSFGMGYVATDHLIYKALILMKDKRKKYLWTSPVEDVKKVVNFPDLINLG